MEVSLFGSSQMGRIDSCDRELMMCFPRNCNSARILSRNTDNGLWFGQSMRSRKAGLRLTLRAIQSEPVRSDRVSLRTSTKPRSLHRVRLFVGLPLDSVSECNTVNHARAIAAGLKALKLLGVEGVELPVWWGIAEKEAMGKYDWSGYLLIADMVQKAGLKLHVSLCFHASTQPKISLPEWVSRIGDSKPGIFFADRSGQCYKECLSLAVDDLPVLDGKTPIHVYQDFCENFKSTFLSFMGSTITGISMGLGPEGELRYPSLRRLADSNKLLGAGEFQCYDQNMLGLLKQHAEANGKPLWGLGGPHDVPGYDETPNSNSFFKDNGGSWASPYGDFFLSWYSSRLLSHGDRLLSLASSTFSDTSVEVCGKVPLMHPWYKTLSHPSELTAGFYNTNNRDGYEEVAEMFAKNSCKMIVPGMDLSDDHQPQESLSSPELLLAQIRRACRKHGVGISGQNSSVSGVPGGFEQMQLNLSGENGVDLFTYQRMGAFFFSPEHFPSFTKFVRRLDQPAWHSDGLPLKEELEDAELSSTSSESEIHMQVA